MPEKIAHLPLQLHASCVGMNGRAVLILGASGSGKSDLALRLIDAGATLVADDRVILEPDFPDVRVRPPKALEGLLEARGVGIMHMPFEAGMPLALIVEATLAEERLPEREVKEFFGLPFPCIRLELFHGSTSAKVRLALATSLAERLLKAPQEHS